MPKMISLEKFAGGTLAEKFDIALKEVLQNITDPNTDWKTKRKLTLELSFNTEEDRELSTVEIVTKTKLASAKSTSTKIIIDSDGNGGIIASEYKNQLKGQQYLSVDTDTGEILTPEKEEEIDIKGIRLVK